MVVRVYWLLLAGLVVAALLTGSVAWWWSETGAAGQFSARSVRGDSVESFVRALDASTPAQRSSVLALGAAVGMRVIAEPSAEPRTVGGTSERVAEALGQMLASGLARPARVSAIEDRALCAGPRWGSATCFLLRTHLDDGTPLLVAVTPTGPWRSAPGHWAVDGFWLLPLGLLFVLAALITRFALSPLARLTEAADRFADDVDAPALEERGPREIRRAVSVFNRMQTRIRAHVVERTSMLAAIAHDLQTPLTRLRLRVEDVADVELRDKMAADLAECRQRVQEGLELARSIDDRTPLSDVDLGALLRSACDEASDAGGMVHLGACPPLVVRARPQALLRCIENLIGNAIKYGHQADLEVAVEGPTAIVFVRDRGPGIAPADLERVFEPFVRVETSRSRQTGGTGLGLYIVRNLIQRQGGSISLRNRGTGPSDGLEARLTVPLAA